MSSDLSKEAPGLHAARLARPRSKPRQRWDAVLRLDVPSAFRRLAGQILELARSRLGADHTTPGLAEGACIRPGPEVPVGPGFLVAPSEDLLARCRRLLGGEHEATRWARFVPR